MRIFVPKYIHIRMNMEYVRIRTEKIRIETKTHQILTEIRNYANKEKYSIRAYTMLCVHQHIIFIDFQ